MHQQIISENIMKQYKLIFITGLLSILFYTSGFSQRITSYWMKNLPQGNYLNPAKESGCKIFIDIPVLPNFDINLTHSGFTINDAIKQHPFYLDSFMIDLDGIEKALKTGNNINAETEISILNFGLALKNDLNISFGVNYKLSEFFEYPKALIELRRGNYRKNETPLAFNFRQNLNLYREIYIGASKNFNNTLYLGAKLKYLSGYANIKTNKMDLEWYTSIKPEDMYDWTFNSDFDINAASIIPWNFTDSAGQINGIDIDTTLISNPSSDLSSLLFPKNTGLGIDLGIEYILNNRLTLSASLIDFGYISWKTNSKIMTQQATFKFSGLDIAKYIGNLNDTTGENTTLGEKIKNDMIDTLMNVFNPTIEETAYRTSLNSKIYLGANLKITNWLNTGFLYKGIFFNKSLISAWSFSANANLFKALSYSVSYTIMNASANNIGMGLAYKAGPFQMYLITDNMAAPFWAVNGSNFSDEWLKNTKTFNFSFGLNFLICGNKYDIGLME
ncbi:MAG: hypothetical protein DRI94_05075 [Bacteroidetes bacterium]|nr:MAG: hypothetical protein DRI94_05075 [Bacteroidota bacterium]